MGNENNQSSDKIFVAKILNGSTQDFAVVVKSTEKLVTHIARKMTANEDDQKDLCQFKLSIIKLEKVRGFKKN